MNDEIKECECFIDLDMRCGKPVYQVVHEPFTPAQFAIECCQECAEGMIRQGYIAGDFAAQAT